MVLGFEGGKKGNNEMKIKYNHTVEELLDRIRVIVYVDWDKRVVHDFDKDQRNINNLIETITTEEIYDDMEMA